MKITTRLFLYISALILLTSVGLGYISVRDERSHLMAEARMMARTLARTLAATFKYYHMEEQQKRLGEIIHAVMPHDVDINSLLLNIYDRRGRLVQIAYEHGLNREELRRDRDPALFLRGGREEIMRQGGHEYLSVIVPIVNSGGDLQGAVEILFSLESIDETLTGIIRKFVVFDLLTAALLGVLLYLVNRWSITLPIARLQDASKKLGRGDLGLRLARSGVRELDDLIEEFNRMARNLEKQNRHREKLFAEKIDLERGLRHRDKLASIGQLASGLAHEIGTPLNVISGRAEHLLRKTDKDSPNAENLKIIIRQADRITRTMRQMLAFSRKSTAEFSAVDLVAIAHDAFSLCGLKQRKDHPPIELSLDFAVERLLADEDGLRQLFVNLMLNSFQAMPGGGAIRIRSEARGEKDDEIILTYEDTGPGIPDELCDRIFDPFFTTKEVGKGTGLGLFMVANIVQEHQGRIRLDCSYDQGARFFIVLPRNPVSAGLEESGQKNG